MKNKEQETRNRKQGTRYPFSFLLSAFCFLLSPVFANETLDKDKEIVETFIHSDERNNCAKCCMTEAALYLLDTPYVAATLEGNKEERLVVNLRELDCTTFVENCLAMTLSLTNDSLPSFESFTNYLKEIRYRGGIINGYPSRLHYFTDWIIDNTFFELVEDITYDLGGKPFTPNVYYMSTNPDKYPALKGRPDYIASIKQAEKRINANDSLFYIPNKHIDIVAEDIRDGDIVAFVTSTSGLDVQHLGIAFWDNRHLTFIHASSRAKKVIINPESLADYCTKQKNIIGIMVLRTK
jgi:Protein of unknown function (DUF1460).